VVALLNKRRESPSIIDGVFSDFEKRGELDLRRNWYFLIFDYYYVGF